jgi:hypothetical protein
MTSMYKGKMYPLLFHLHTVLPGIGLRRQVSFAAQDEIHE